jgi:DNA-directed RNA polymerase subunit RPC12/RpoP
MSKLTDRASFLRGLAEGMKLNPEKDSNRILLELLDLVGEMADELETLKEAQGDLSDFVDMIDDDLSAVEEVLCEEEDEEEDPRWDDGDDDEDGEDDVSVVYDCPHCGKEITLSLDDLDLEEDMACPECGQPLFPGAVDEDDEEASPKEQPEDGEPVPGEDLPF